MRESLELVHISVGNETVTTTPNHPFFTIQKEFVKAVELRAGDILCTVNGEYVIVEQVQHEILESPVKVYNFRVAENHTYYVGKTSVGVHNAQCGETEGSGENNTGSGSQEGNTSALDKARNIAKQVKDRNGAPLKGYKGGRIYKNIPLEEGAQKLPDGVNYKEYDVNPYVKGKNRGAERIVIGNDGSVWYTNDHYFSFTQIE